MSPAGTPASTIISQNFTALSGVSTLGLITMVLPVTSAGAALRAMRKKGNSRENTADDTDWLTKHEDGFAQAIALEDLAFNAASPFGHIVDVVGREGDLHSRQTQGLALLLSDDTGDLVSVLADSRRNGVQHLGALDGGSLCPFPLRQSAAEIAAVTSAAVLSGTVQMSCPFDGFDTSGRLSRSEGTNSPSMKF